MNGHDDTVRILLEGSASPVNNAKIPLMYARAYSNNNVVTMLLYFGADPNQKENGGWTPFPTACQNGHKGIVQLLVKLMLMLV